MKKITITKALVDLKTLGKRIDRSIKDSSFVGSVRGSADTTTKLVSKEKFTKDAQSAFKSVKALIKNRGALKRAIVISNASTNVEVDSTVYSVAEAIERKNSIQYEKDFLSALKGQLSNVEEYVTQVNTRVELDLVELIKGLSSGDRKPDKSLIDSVTNEFRELHEQVILDPINVRDVIEKLQIEIDNFEADVDTALSESNAVTLIEV